MLHADSEKTRLYRALEEARQKAHEIVDRTENGLKGIASTTDAALTAPTELRARMKEEEALGHIEGPLHALSHRTKDGMHKVKKYLR